MDTTTAWKTLRDYAEGRIEHKGEGMCPDVREGHDVRDGDCAVCKALDALRGCRAQPIAGYLISDPSDPAIKPWLSDTPSDDGYTSEPLYAGAAPAAVAPQGVKFFSAGTEGLEEHDTAEAAQAAAQEEIDIYREEAADGWPEEVDSVCWGVILGKAVERPVKDAAFMAGIMGSDMEPVDYVLEPVAAPALEAPAAPVLHDIDSGIEVMAWLRENRAPHSIYCKMSACLFGDPDKPRTSTAAAPQAHAAPEAVPQVQPFETAPKDGTIVRLLVQFVDHPPGQDNVLNAAGPLYDTEGPCWTIGGNTAENTGENLWQFVGWNWQQDCFEDTSTDAGHRVLGWAPFDGAAPAAPVGLSHEQTLAATRAVRKVLEKEQAVYLANASILSIVKAVEGALSEAPAPHSDDVAVDRFAAEMKAKLAAAREKGRRGWETCPPEVMSRMLREHVEKGDPRDVANFYMFLWCLGQPIAAAPAEPIAVLVREIGEDSYFDHRPVRPGSDEHKAIQKSPQMDCREVYLEALQPAPASPAVDALPNRTGVYAWVSGPSVALVLVDQRPSRHEPGGQWNGHVVQSIKFYDGCAVSSWGRDGHWVLLHDFAAAQAKEGGA